MGKAHVGGDGFEVNDDSYLREDFGLSVPLRLMDLEMMLNLQCGGPLEMLVLKSVVTPGGSAQSIMKANPE